MENEKHASHFIKTKLLLLFLFFITGSSFTQTSNVDKYVENQVIIKMKSNIRANDITDLKRQLNASVLKQFSLIDAQLWEISGITVRDAITEYRNDPRIQYIEPNYVVHAIDDYVDIIPNDPYFNSLWGLHNVGQAGGTPDADIDAPEAWDIQTGTNVLIGVIDSGVDWGHEDLDGNIWTNPGEISGNGIDDDGNGYIDDVHGYDFVNNDGDPFDDYWHGTHVSGTIAAEGNNGVGVTGVNWSAKIMGIKFLGAGGSGSTSNAILSLEYATLMGIQLTNNSWGGGAFSYALKDAIEASGNAGMLFIAAAGNDGVDNDISPHYPSSYALDNIIAVAATDYNDQKRISSNFGATSVDLGAPGTSIFSTFPGNNYAVASGTSMAAPHVTGVAALIWANNPGLSYSQVKSLILDNVDPIPALSGITVTGGRLNAFNALTGTAPALPDIGVSPDSFTFDVPFGGSDSDILTISNTAPPGALDLNWNISHTSLNTISASVLLYGSIGNAEAQRLSNLGATVTILTDINLLTEAYLNQFDVFFIPLTMAQSLASKATIIQNYVNNGNGLIVEHPNVIGPVAIMPPGFEVVVSSIGGLGVPVAITLEGRAHPILHGLSDTDVTGVADIVYNTDVGSDYTVLAYHGVYTNVIALAAGQYVDGRIIFLNGLIYPGTPAPGSDQYVVNMFNWAAGVPFSENPSSGTIPAGGNQNLDIMVYTGELSAGTYRHRLFIYSNADTDTVPVTLNVYVLDSSLVTWCEAPGPITGITGTQDTIFICVDDVTGLNVISYQSTITFDNSVLNCVGATSAGTITEPWGSPTTNCTVPGQITVGGFGTAPLSGSSALVGLIFDVVGAQGATTNVCIQDMLFNAGNPIANIPNPCIQYQVLNEFDISGIVTYCPNGNPVLNTNLILSGAISDTQSTNASGNYAFLDITAGMNYTVTPEKIGDVEPLSDISCYDAALAAQIAVGLLTADHCDSIEADVDEDGNIFTFDAALICRYAVGLPPFGPTDHTAEWRLEPSNRSYTPLNSNQLNQNYTASLLGDVDGNWAPTAPEPMIARGEAYEPLSQLRAGQGEILSIPFVVETGQEIISADIDFKYNPDIMEFVEVSRTNLSQGFEMVVNAEEGRVRIGAFSTEAVTEEGVFLLLRFRITGKEKEEGKLTLANYQLNGVTMKQGEVNFVVGQSSLPTKFALHQNYPNPFNPETIIGFDIPAVKQKTVRVRLSIYNIAGQLVRTLINDPYAPGAYEVIWNGRDDNGKRVASGVYFYSLSAGDFFATRKMLVLK